MKPVSRRRNLPRWVDGRAVISLLRAMPQLESLSMQGCSSFGERRP